MGKKYSDANVNPSSTCTVNFAQTNTHTSGPTAGDSTTLTPYTSGFNGQAYSNPSSNFQDMYTTIAYTDPIPLPGSALGFLRNHAYQTPPCFNAYGQPKADGFGYGTPPQFPFIPHPVDMMPGRATTKLGVDPNNLTNQLPTILRESFGIEPKGHGRVYQKLYHDYYNQLP
jgi:hypothetical protein